MKPTQPILPIVMAAAAWLFASAPASEPLVVHVGYQPSSYTHILAKEKGWFEEEFAKDGIVIKHDLFPVGPPIVESFASGRTDIGYMADQPPIQGRANQINIKAIALTGSSEKNTGLLVGVNSGIKTLKDLKGKKVATSVGSVHHQLLLIYLKSVGLSLSDIQLVNLVPADVNNALQSGHVDAVVNTDPYNQQAIRAGYGKLLLDATGYKNIVSLIIGRDKFLQAHPQVVARFLKVYVRSEQYLYDHLDESVAFLQKPMGFKPEFLKPLLLGIRRGQGFRPDAVASVAATAEFLFENHIIRRKVDVKDLFDDRYLQLAGLPVR